jgi:hypothetical protein
LIETNDGGYVFHGQWRISSLPNFTQYFVQRLNTSKQIQWEQKFYDALNRINVFNDFIEDNNAFIFMGGHQDSMGNKNHSVISKINAAGQRVWHRNINKFARDNYSRDIEKTSDGGFIIAGFGSEFLPNGMYSQEAWLCKVDSFGCLQQGCELLDAIEETSPTAQEELNVFPNPVKHQLFIEGKTSIQNLRIYNLLGELVYSESKIHTSNKQINVETLKSGIYILQIESQTGSTQHKFVKE